MSRARSFVDLCLEFSVPLLSGVVAALLMANLEPELYAAVLHWMPLGDWKLLGHTLDFHFIVNDIFMVFFFGIAAKEITEACLPGGSLNPPRKAVTPLVATLGGVFGPVGVFFLALWAAMSMGAFESAFAAGHDNATLARGWGVPTATDIALAWLVARTVFGKGHPAVVFLLLLAVADDAIGLVIIAVFYGDPTQPVALIWLLLPVAGIGVAAGLRRFGVQSWPLYVGLAGPLVWSGLILAHLHPALALTVVVPFMPGPRRDTGLFVDTDEVDVMGEDLAADLHVDHSPLHQYEHQTKTFVDVGLFFFALANAGVTFASVGPLTWIILIALVVGKTVGITFAGLACMWVRIPLPQGMTVRDLVMAGFIAALGLTVALFVATAAYIDPLLQGQAKMGALFSGLVGLVALPLGRLLRVGNDPEDRAESGALAEPEPPAAEPLARE